LEQTKESPAEQTALVAASASIAFDLQLGVNAPGRPVFGNFQVKLGYDALQLEHARSYGAYHTDTEMVIVCKTLINGDWYAAVDVCAFAQMALSKALDLPKDAPGVFKVDTKACKVSCSIRRGRNEDLDWLLYLGHRLLAIYEVYFFGAVANIYPRPAPERIPLPEEEEGDGALASDT
jgi:hypothetical protein